MKGDWFTNIVLKDAYFHIPIVPHHRKFLRFCFKNQAYQFKVLPFGLSLAPCVFTRCMTAALCPLYSPEGYESCPTWTTGYCVSPQDSKLSTTPVCSCFLPVLSGRHVLIRLDNTLFHLNHQGASLHLTRKILTWSVPNLASLRAVHLSISSNQVADALSRNLLHPGEWRLPPNVVQRIWQQFGRAEIDLFAKEATTHYCLWFARMETSSLLSSPLVPSSSVLPERPRESALPKRPRESALPERPRESALPERPRKFTPVPAPRQRPPVPALRMLPPVPAPRQHNPEPAPVQELTVSTPEPTPFQELTESTPEPALVQELTESTPEPAPFQELSESTPEPTPFQELTESTCSQSPLQSPLRSRSSQSPLQSPLRSRSSQSPLQSPLRSRSSQSPLQSPLRSRSSQSPLQSPFRSRS